MKVISSDLSSANNNPNVIASVGSSAASLSEKTIYFTNGSTNNLDGKANTLLLNKLNEYSTLFNNINQLSANLIQSIISANNQLLAYMDGYNELDDSRIGEIRDELNNARNYLIYLNQDIQVQIGIDQYTNEPIFTTRKRGTDTEISSWTDKTYELEKFLGKLEGLAGADSNAYSIIENYETMINKLKNQIDNLETSTYSTNAISFNELQEIIKQLKEIQSDNEIFNAGLQVSELYNVSNIKPLFTSYIDDKGVLQIIPLLPNNQRLWNEAIKNWLHGNELGGNKNAPFTLTDSEFETCGCGTCVAAEIFSNLTGDTVSPIDILTYMYRKTGYVHKQDADSLFINSASDFGCEYEELNSASDVNSIVKALDNNGNVAIAVADGSHWMAITDYTEDQNGNIVFTVMDPFAEISEKDDPYQQMTMKDLIGYNYNGGSGGPSVAVAITPTKNEINTNIVKLNTTYNEIPEPKDSKQIKTNI